jgi:hypothetical protein
VVTAQAAQAASTAAKGRKRDMTTSTVGRTAEV